ncbi:MAG: LytR C-terminal domain-containing protein [Actinomycetaceae bacterium]|nr:LytR C-terminal domain-containing protein [Actinomycetaceae bacterium]
MSSNQYPEDEFDETGREFPVGVHRKKPSQWKSVLPFLLVLIIVPILAWAMAYVFTHRGDDDATPEAAPSATATPTASEEEAEPSEEPAEEPSEEPAEEPSEEPSEEPAEVNYDAPITVLNGTNTNGLAGSVSQKLQDNGFTSVEAGNATGWRTEQTVVYYKPGKEADAQEVSRILNIDLRMENSSDLGEKDMIIVLKGDFQQ